MTNERNDQSSVPSSQKAARLFACLLAILREALNQARAEFPFCLLSISKYLSHAYSIHQTIERQLQVLQRSARDQRNLASGKLGA
jgi:hypothetical protein